ncbi:MAG: hypothetical protein KGZ94_08765 [Clostridia bacterium]|jgi:hypothetical protein|nr:hypothetical protein [Clostridia bacterium]
MIETTINAQTKTFLSEAELAKLISNKVFSSKYMVQIYNFFSDVPAQDIDLFITVHKISDRVLKDYYETYIKHIYPNSELEELVYYAE